MKIKKKNILMELEDITQSLGFCIARLTEKITLYEWTIKGLKTELEYYRAVCKKNNIHNVL